MSSEKGSILILSITSDIATEYALRKKNHGYSVYGTYRTITDEKYKIFSQENIEITQMDLTKDDSLDKAISNLTEIGFKWDCLMIGSGTVAPIGPFEFTPINEWIESTRINLTGPMYFVNKMLPLRNKDLINKPAIIFFSGSGTNDAPLNYSAYTISKIALIKACEILDKEIQDAKFAIIGPGIVDTKIHNPTILLKNKYTQSWKKLNNSLELKTCTPIEDVLDCCDWVMSQPKEVVGGKNFSVNYDRWREGKEFEDFIKINNNYLKLRRCGNNHEEIAIKPRV